MTAVAFFSVIQELVHREGLRVALSGRDDVLLEPILQMLSNYVADTRWGVLACEVAGVVLGEYERTNRKHCTYLVFCIDMYASVVGLSPVIDAELVNLRRKVQGELKLQENLARLRGAVDMILSASVL